MNEEQKRTMIMDYLNEKIFQPGLDIAKREKIHSVVKGINLTKGRMSTLSAAQMVHFFWSAVSGTEKSINFYNTLKEYDILAFEDIIPEFRLKFNDKFLES